MRFVLACHTNCYGPFGAIAAIQHVRAAGLEWIELPIRTAGVRNRWGDPPLVDSDASSGDVSGALRILSDHGVRVASATCLAGSPLEPVNFELALRKLELAVELGASTVVVDAGDADSEDARRLVCARLAELGDRAESLSAERPVTLCLEMHRGLCVNHRGMAELLTEIDHPRVRGNFDTGNLLYYNDNVHGEAALARTCHWMKHVRLKDSTGERGRLYSPALGRGGAVDFLRAYQIMRDCGFRGPFSIAIDGVDGEPEPTLDVRQARVVESVEYLRSLGYFD